MGSFENNHQIEEPTGSTSRLEQSIKTGTSIFFFLLGIYLTFLVLVSLYGERAMSQFLKGISLLNMIDIIIEANFTEVVVLIYLFTLFGILLFIDKVLIGKGISTFLSVKQYSFISLNLHSFREGSFTLPILIMIGSPLLLQVIMPSVIVFIAIVELLLPFIIIGELYNVSEGNLKRLIENIRPTSPDLIHSTVTKDPSSVITEGKFRTFLDYFIMISSILIFPFVVFTLLESGMDQFLHLVYFNLLWENPESSTQIFWNIINGFIGLVSFNINVISAFLQEIKYFVVTFIVLVLTSKIYFIVKNLSRTRMIRLIERTLLTY